MCIYIDRVFALNLAVDYLLLLTVARLAGTFAASAVFAVRRGRRAIRDRRIPAGPELAGSSGRKGYRRRSFSLGSLRPGAAYAEAYGTIFPPFRGVGRCDPCVGILHRCPGAPLEKNLSGGD